MLNGFEIFGVRLFDLTRAFGYEEVFVTLVLIGIFTGVVLVILSSMDRKDNTRIT